MARFILIDSTSGHIVGDTAAYLADPADAWDQTPIEAVRHLDKNIGRQGWSYEDVGPRSLNPTESGYFVYQTEIDGPWGVAVVQDGQDRETIKKVRIYGQHCTTIQCFAPQEPMTVADAPNLIQKMKMRFRSCPHLEILHDPAEGGDCYIVAHPRNTNRKAPDEIKVQVHGRILRDVEKELAGIIRHVTFEAHLFRELALADEACQKMISHMRAAEACRKDVMEFGLDIDLELYQDRAMVMCDMFRAAMMFAQESRIEYAYEDYKPDPKALERLAERRGEYTANTLGEALSVMDMVP